MTDPFQSLRAYLESEVKSAWDSFHETAGLYQLGRAEGLGAILQLVASMASPGPWPSAQLHWSWGPLPAAETLPGASCALVWIQDRNELVPRRLSVARVLEHEQGRQWRVDFLPVSAWGRVVAWAPFDPPVLETVNIAAK